MSDRRLTHDLAWDAAVSVVRLFSGCLREEERVEAFHEVYELLLARFEQLLVRRDREASRLGRNRPT